MLKKSFLFFIILVIILSCQKVIDLGLDEGSNIDVVDAYIYDTIGFVRVYKSNKQFYVKDEPIVIKNVDVEVIVDDINIYKLLYTDNLNISDLVLGQNEYKDGYFFKGIKNGKIYKLKITMPDGSIYISKQKKFEVPIVSDVNFYKDNTLRPGGSNDKDAYLIDIETQKAPNDFEALRVFIKYKKENKSGNQEISYKYSHYGLDVPPFKVRFSDLYMKNNDSIYLNCSYTTNNAKKYYDVLSRIAGNGAPSAVRVPENPPTNIQVEKGNVVLGVFAVYNFSETKVISTNIN